MAVCPDWTETLAGCELILGAVSLLELELLLEDELELLEAAAAPPPGDGDALLPPQASKLSKVTTKKDNLSADKLHSPRITFVVRRTAGDVFLPL